MVFFKSRGVKIQKTCMFCDGKIIFDKFCKIT